MSKNPITLKIAYLYPDILQSDCDEANIATLYKRAKWRDIDVKIIEIKEYDTIQSSKYDLYYIGGSNSEVLNYIINCIKKNKDELKVASIANVPMLAVNCGFQLFGDSFQLQNKSRIKGIEIFRMDSIATKNKYISPVIANCSFLQKKSIAGYKNQSAIAQLKENTLPFLTLQKGLGNNLKDKNEGAKFNNAIGTFITSPILAHNPNLCDWFLSSALRVKYKCKIPLTQLCDDIEWYAHDYILNSKCK